MKDCLSVVLTVEAGRFRMCSFLSTCQILASSETPPDPMGLLWSPFASCSKCHHIQEAAGGPLLSDNLSLNPALSAYKL